MNRLAQEKSPYLLQHATNPVDWYPWGDEAFEKARREQKPVFVSIGYSTCHWCHVMEHESFEDPAVAEIMNKFFVSIKVDREERPDIDRVYMTFVQATTGSGGWPMSVFLTPDRKPFLGGTYFPPDPIATAPGFRTILARVEQAWREQRPEVLSSAERVVGAMQEMANHGMEAGERPGMAAMDEAYKRFSSVYDREEGGFGRAPKFPRPSVLNFFICAITRAQANSPRSTWCCSPCVRWRRAGCTIISAADSIATRWTASGTCRTSRRCCTTRRSLPRPTRRRIRLRTMRFTPASRAMCWITCCATCTSAMEASSPLRTRIVSPKLAARKSGEGAFYVWTSAEIDKALGADAAKAFKKYYGVEANGNVAPDADQQGEFKGHNILILRTPIADADRVAMAAARGKLLAARAQHPRPGLDDKVLVAWNGLMISALARASQATRRCRVTATAAQRAAHFHRVAPV